MSNLYDEFREDAVDGTSPDLSGGTLAVSLLSSSYTFSKSHALVDISGLVGSPEFLTGVTIGADGTVDADDVTFESVSGSAANAVLLFLSGSPGTPVAYIDGISVTPDGEDIRVEWDASGIFRL